MIRLLGMGHCKPLTFIEDEMEEEKINFMDRCKKCKKIFEKYYREDLEHDGFVLIEDKLCKRCINWRTKEDKGVSHRKKA